MVGGAAAGKGATQVMVQRAGTALIGLAAAAVAMGSLAAAGGRALAPGDVVVYGDALGGGWSDWSWDTAVALDVPSPARSGAASMAVTFTAAWGGLYLHVAPSLVGTSFHSLRFAIHGGSAGGQKARVMLADGGGELGPAVAVGALAGEWTEVEVPLGDLGGPAEISGLVLQDTSGGAQPVLYLDEVVLVAGSSPPSPTPTPTAGPAIAVNAAAGVHEINEDIYGMNFADEALAAELRLPVRRLGRQLDEPLQLAATTPPTPVSDWYFENIAGADRRRRPVRRAGSPHRDADRC